MYCKPDLIVNTWLFLITGGMVWNPCAGTCTITITIWHLHNHNHNSTEEKLQLPHIQQLWLTSYCIIHVNVTLTSLAVHQRYHLHIYHQLVIIIFNIHHHNRRPSSTSWRTWPKIMFPLPIGPGLLFKFRMLFLPKRPGLLKHLLGI